MFGPKPPRGRLDHIIVRNPGVTFDLELEELVQGCWNSSLSGCSISKVLTDHMTYTGRIDNLPPPPQIVLKVSRVIKTNLSSR